MFETITAAAPAAAPRPMHEAQRRASLRALDTALVGDDPAHPGHEALANLVRLQAALAAQDTVPAGLLAFLDADGSLTRALDVPSVEAFADEAGLEGLRAALKALVQKVADAFTGRGKAFSEEDLAKFKKGAAQSAIGHTQRIQRMIAECRTEKPDPDAFAIKAGWDEMYTVKGAQAILASLAKTGQVVKQLCHVPAATDPTKFDEYVAALDKALAPFDKEWALCVSRGGLAFSGERWKTHDSVSDAGYMQGNPTVAEYGYTNVAVIAGLLQKAAQTIAPTAALADVVIATIRAMNKQRDELHAKGETASAAAVQRSAQLLGRAASKLLSHYLIWETDEVVIRCSYVMEILFRSYRPDED